MQPNQQDPNQPTLPPQPPVVSVPAAPLPYQVPSYLGMDPVTGQPPKSHKKLLFIVIGVVFVLLCAVGGYVYWQWQQSVPETRFYSALENAMSTKYIGQKITSNSKNASLKFSVTSNSDFSSPAHPQSRSQYSLTLPDQVIQGASKKIQFQGDEIFSNDQDLVERFSVFPTFSHYKVLANQWYRVSLSDAPNMQKYDILDLKSLVNNPFARITFGNIDANNGAKIVDYIKKNAIYSIQKSEAENINGYQTTEYSVTTDDGKLANLNKYEESLLSLPTTSVSSSSKLGTLKKMNVWVDNKSDTFLRASYDFGANTDAKDTSTVLSVQIDFTYPNSLKIDNPTNVLSLP